MVTVRFAVVPATSVVTPPADNASLLAGPGAMVALKLHVNVPAVALKVCVPRDPPAVAVVEASPFAFVTALVGLTEPPPDTTLNVTVTPGNTLPKPSVT